MSDDTAPMPGHEEIISWLARQGFDVESVEPLAGDVSLRRYLRVRLHRDSAIVAVYPESIRAACRNFVLTSTLLARVGVRVPRVLASDCDQGLALVEDLGTETLYDRRGSDSATLSGYFWRAAEDQARIRALPSEEVETLNPRLDRELLWRELGQTWDCLLEPNRVVEDGEFSSALRDSLRDLCTRLEQPLVPCHRDFMARNLIPVDPFPTLAVIDHQDLRLGPLYYDLASLLNDSLFPSEDLESEIVRECLDESTSAERIRYHRAAAQRTLKAAGTYETFGQRGFPRHRGLIPVTLARALRHLGHLPEIAGIYDQLAHRMAPLLIC